MYRFLSAAAVAVLMTCASHRVIAQDNVSIVVDCDSCGTAGCQSCVGVGPVLNAGFEFTFLQPRFGSNVAFTTMQADGASFESFRDSEFDYDLEFSPRVWASLNGGNGFGLRATYWQLEQDANALSASPPANGFGRISHPAFGDIDISSTIPSDRFTAGSSIEAYTIDLEATKDACLANWFVSASTGIRFASIQQSYRAELTDSAGTARGRIDHQQSLDGIGPTIAVLVARPVTYNLALFGSARGSLLLAEGQSNLNAGEDLDLATPFLTGRITDRDDLLPIGEIQFGFEWQPPAQRRYAFQPYIRAAIEGQVWSGAGNANSEDGNVGLMGFNVGIGFLR